MKKYPLLKIDFYKADHIRQYPKGITEVYSNFTPRKSRIPGVNSVVFFGLQAIIKDYLINEFQEAFFDRDEDDVVYDYKRIMDNSLGKDAINVDHIRDLHKLGYLPIEIKALDEGTIVPIKVPVFTIRNTHGGFFWLTNYLESVISNKLWKMSTAATIAFEYRKVFEEFYNRTVGDIPPDRGPIMYQGHNFAYRGASGDDDACFISAGHATSFYGDDTVLGIAFLEEFYNANSDKEIVLTSIPATEHSVMCAGGKETEIDTFRRLITETYRSGPVSIVSDSWDYFRVISEYAEILKVDILNREGHPFGFDRVVFRGDSGIPEYILAGWPNDMLISDPKGDGFFMDKDGKYVTKTGEHITELERMGTVEILYNIFGGTTTARGYKLLNSKVGTIYGDSITPAVQLRVLELLEAKGFASTNVVLGIGSFTYEYLTRDSLGWAMKATNVTMEEDGGDAPTITDVEIFKDPKTDNGVKKSARGLLKVYRDDDGTIMLKDRCSRKEENEGLLTPVFVNGELLKDISLNEVRERLTASL
jgi:nicotinamide phosphoribosyltransferase